MMTYITELHAQVFAIAFVAGVVGNLAANVVQSIYTDIRLAAHHRKIRDAVQSRKER